MRSLLAALTTCALLYGCSQGHSSDQSAQTGLPTTRIVIDTQNGPVAFTVEVADDLPSQEKGLMFRTNLAPDAGMIFDFHKPDYQSFWMKNTPLSLDMLFIKSDGTISTIAANTIPYSTDPVLSSEPVRAVLEINGGRAYALDIVPGDKVHAAMFGNLKQ